MKDIAYQEMYQNESSHPWYIATRKLMIINLKKAISTHSKILDVGCGTGGTMLCLKQAGFKQVFGIDNSPLALEYSKKRGLKNITLGDINNIPFKRNTFDAVICMDVLYHKGVSAKKSLSEINRVLKKNGILYLQEPAYNLIRSKHDVAIETGKRFTSKSIRNLAKGSKFKILKISYFNTTFLIPISLRRIIDKFSKDKEINSDVHKLRQPLKFLMAAALSFEINLVSYLNLPIGLSIICIARK